MASLRTILSNIEIFFEDLVLVLISVFTTILAIAALTILSTESSTVVAERAQTISVIAQASFLAKAEYFAALLMPWIVIIAMLMIARELWLIRRRMDFTHYMRMRGMVQNRVVKKRKK